MNLSPLDGTNTDTGLSQEKVQWFLLCGKNVTRFVKKPLLPTSLTLRFLNFKISLQGAQVAGAVTHSFPLRVSAVPTSPLVIHILMLTFHGSFGAVRTRVFSPIPLHYQVPDLLTDFPPLNVSLTGK